MNAHESGHSTHCFLTIFTMFDILVQHLKKFGKSPETFTPSIFNDSMAEQISWKSMESPKILNCDRKLSINAETAEFKVTQSCPFFSMLFSAILFYMLRPADILWWTIFLGIISTISIIYYFISAPILFSKKQGYLYKGRNFKYLENSRWGKERIAIEEIYAIQLIATKHLGRKVTSFGYELNVVLKNKARINVISHSNSNHAVKENMRKNAAELAIFLNVPVWDAMDYQLEN